MDRVTVSRTLVAHMMHRQETRWHCYQERLDFPERNDERWGSVFVNSVRKGERVEMVERQVERAVLEFLVRARNIHEIQFVNGLKPGQLTAALNGEPVGTVIYKNGEPR